MMGLLFTLFVGGVSCAIILGVVAAWRWLVPFTLIPILAAVGAGVLCLGLAAVSGGITSSSQAGFIALLAGYFSGGLFGAGLGASVALWSIRERLQVSRWREPYLHCRQRALDIARWLYS